MIQKFIILIKILITFDLYKRISTNDMYLVFLHVSGIFYLF